MKMPDLIPQALKIWLTANGKGEIADAGFHPMVAFTLGTGQQNMPPVPDDVLTTWARAISTERIMVLQGSMALIRQAHRAGKSDEQVRRMLLLDGDTSLDNHFDLLQREVTHLQARISEATNGADVGELQREMDVLHARMLQTRAGNTNPTR